MKDLITSTLRHNINTQIDLSSSLFTKSPLLLVFFDLLLLLFPDVVFATDLLLFPDVVFATDPAVDCGPLDDAFLSFLKKLNNPFFFFVSPVLSVFLVVPVLVVYEDLSVLALGEVGGEATMVLGDNGPAGYSAIVGAVSTDTGVWGTIRLEEDSPAVVALIPSPECWPFELLP